MGTARAVTAVKTLTEAGGRLAYAPDYSRLLVQVQRTLAEGRPVSSEEVGRCAAAIGITHHEADTFLRTVTERDQDNTIVGALGLSLNDHPHRFAVNDVQLSTWCAMDTLFLPAVLQQTATVASPSPVSGQVVRLTVSPQGVEAVSPTGAVVSMPIVDPEAVDVGSVEAIWGTFCHQIFFFASREEAQAWAAGRPTIEILSVDQAFELGRVLASRLLALES